MDDGVRLDDRAIFGTDCPDLESDSASHRRIQRKAEVIDPEDTRSRVVLWTGVKPGGQCHKSSVLSPTDTWARARVLSQDLVVMASAPGC